MLKITPTYRLPFFIALMLHMVLFLFLWAHVPARQYHFPNSASKSQSLEATAIDSRKMTAQIAKIKDQEAKKRAAARFHLQQLQAKAMAAKKNRLHEQRYLAQLKAQRLRLEREKQQLEQEKQHAKLEKQQMEQEKRHAEQEKRHAEQEKRHAEQERLRIEQQKKLAASRLKALQSKRKQILKLQSKKLQHQLMQQQLQAEKKELAKVKSAQLRGLLDRYKAAILKEIGQKWIIPGGTNENLSCVYSIQLAPGGVVLDVKLLRSSGNPVLDRSARVAIYKASPLSVPKDPALFDNFRQLRLTVSPKSILKRSE